MPGKSRSRTHHCPLENKGEGKCSFGKRTPQNKPYCSTHSTFCDCGWTHLKTEECPRCSKAKNQESDTHQEPKGNKKSASHGDRSNKGAKGQNRGGKASETLPNRESNSQETRAARRKRRRGRKAEGESHRKPKETKDQESEPPVGENEATNDDGARDVWDGHGQIGLAGLGFLDSN